MKLLKDSLKVLGDYAVSLLVFSLFIFTFYNQRVVYSAVIFIIMVSVIYADIKQLAIKEKRPQYNLKPYPVKGLVLGIIGFSPFIILALIYPMISFSDPIYNNIKRLIFNGLLGPLYFIAKIGGNSYAAYVAATFFVPLISMLSYMAGYYGFNFPHSKKLNKKAPEKKRI